MIVGIDLGTTNSAIGVWRDGAAELIPNRLGHVLTPSAVSIDEKGEVLIGLAARERQSSHPDHTATAFKRYMGTRRPTKLGKRDFSPEELSALVLRRLKEDAETHLGEPVERAVITVPAYFNDKQRKATELAGQLAGLTVERLVNEPTAAALAYSIHQREEDARFLVFDLGGGTFDVSIVEIFEGIIEVRASTGDNQLGGEDFNDVLIALMRESFGDRWGEKARGEDALHQKLREAAERARRDLTSAAETEMRIVWKDEQFARTVSAAEFEERAEPLVARLREPVLRSLRDSNIRPDGLSEIILIGGATRMPLVRRAVARMFGRFPNASVNPDEAVALGAAIQAALKARDAALKEVVVTDVCPFSLGIATSRQLPGGGFEDGIFSPIIERSTVIPASRVESFFSLQDNQQQIDLIVYQGEARKVSDNVEIGRSHIRLPRGPAGQQVDVRFSYDVSGLLEVDAIVPKTGEAVHLTINDGSIEDPRALEKAQAALAGLKVHPRDQEENRAAMARGDKCFENALGPERQQIGELIAIFQAALLTQEPRIIEQARKDFHDALDRFEGQVFL